MRNPIMNTSKITLTVDDREPESVFRRLEDRGFNVIKERLNVIDFSNSQVSPRHRRSWLVSRCLFEGPGIPIETDDHQRCSTQ